MKDHHRIRAWIDNRPWYRASPMDIWCDTDGQPKDDTKVLQFTSRLQDFELCTGLRDKNGVLIYEGDILCVKHIGIKSVYFEDGSFGLDGWGSFQHQDLYLFPDEMEIIGNIHQKEQQ